MFKRNKLLFIILIVLTAGGFLYSWLKSDKIDKPVKYIAFVGKFTDYEAAVKHQSPHNVVIEKILKYYLEEFNNDKFPFRIELKVFDNQKNADTSRKIYEQIAHDEEIMAVVDFTWGAHIKNCADLIKEHGIPVITINPDHNSLDFGGNALFMYNDDEIPFNMAAFIKKAEGLDEVDFIGEKDYPLHQVFLNVLEENDVSVRDTLLFEGASIRNPKDYGPVIRLIDNVYQQKKSMERKHIVFCLHNTIGDSLVSYIDQTYRNMTIIGPTFITNLTADGDYGVGNGNEMVIISRPKDAISKKLTKDLQKLREQHVVVDTLPSIEVFMKRGFDAVQIIKHAVQSNNGKSTIDRDYFRKYINSLAGEKVIGDQDLYVFNEYYASIRELTFGKIENGRMNTHRLQLNERQEVIPNLFFGIEIQDIFDLNVNENSFSADFYYWVKVDTADREVESYISFQNMKQSESERELVIEEIAGDILYRLYRVSGKFFVDYDLRNFPMDHQEIDIIIEILRPIDEVKISFDKESLVADKSVLEKFKVPGWDKLGYFITVNNMMTSSLRGDPKHKSGEMRKFKTFSFSLNVKRRSLSGFLEIILPLTVMSLISIGLLYTKDLSFMTMGEVSVGTFIGIIAFSISLSETTPDTSYLTKADLLFWLSFVVNFIGFMLVIVLNSIYDEITIKRINLTWVRLPLTILYPVALTLILIW